MKKPSLLPLLTEFHKKKLAFENISSILDLLSDNKKSFLKIDLDEILLNLSTFYVQYL